MKQIPIDDLFKDKQQPIFIFNINYNYNQLIKKYGFDYQIWEENVGFMIGGAIEIDRYRYLLKASLNHIQQHSLVAVYALTDSKNLKNASEKFIKTLGLIHDEINGSIA